MSAPISRDANIYLQRINLVLDHIRQNLTEDLSVSALADVAAFSPFHFHRIFTSITGETVNACVNRLRLERAVSLLKGAPEMRITDVAIACGYNATETFSRAFRKRFGMAAREWDCLSPLQDSKNGQVLDGFPLYTIENLSEFDGHYDVDVRRLPAQRLAFIRVTDSYKPDRVMDAYDRLIAWFQGNGGDLSATTLYGMSQDDPTVTPLELCTYDIGLTVPDEWLSDGEISVRELPACTIAAIHCQGDIHVVDRVWQYLFSYWLPRSRYLPDNLPAMEIYVKQPVELGWGVYDLHAAIPVISFI